MRKSNSINMTEGSILPKILLFAIPLAASSMMQLLFNTVDLIVVGKFAGHTAQAAVSSTGSLVALITNLFIGLSVGSNVVVAKSIGSGKQDKIQAAVHTAITLSVVAGIVLTFVGVTFARTFLEWMGSPEDVIDLSTTYLRIYFLGMMPLMLYNFGASVLRAKGDTKRPLYFLLVAGVINAALNLFLVVVVHMDVDGVAIATVFSQIVSAVLVLWCLLNENSEIRLYPKQLGIDREQLKEIIRIGLPAGIQGMVFSISNVTIQSSINSFGSIVMAGNGDASSIEGFVYNAMNSFSQAALTFTSQNLGAKKYERINKVLLASECCVIVTGIVLGGGSYLLGRPLLSIFTDDVAVIDAGMNRLGLVDKCYFLCGIMDVLVGSLRGLGCSVVPMIISLIGACAFRLVWIATVFKSVGTIQCLYLSYPVSWTITAIAQFAVYIIVKRKLMKSIEKAQ